MTILIGSRQPEALGSIKVDSPEWFAWLEEQKSFRFECSYTWHLQAGITNIKDATCTVVKQGKYWNAHKRVSGQLRRYYLGASDKLTYDNLCEAAKTLTINPKWTDYLRAKQSLGVQSHKKEVEVCETERQTTSQTQNENEELKARIAELEQLNKELQTTNQTLEKQLSECCLEKESFQRGYEREAEDAKRYYTLFRKYPHLERKYKQLQEQVDAFEAAPLKILDGWIEANAIDLKPRTADKLRAYREYLLKSAR